MHLFLSFNHDFYFSYDKSISDEYLDYHFPPLDEVWSSELSTVLNVITLKNTVALLKNASK